MNEEKRPEVEAEETSPWDTVLDETVKLFESLGKAIVTASQDISNLMVIRTTPETRESLDQLVNAGLATNRREAASSMIDEGLKVKSSLFEKIQRTNAQIATLKEQMRAIVADRPTA